LLLNVPCDLYAVGLRYDHIHQHQVDVPPGESERIDRFGAVLGLEDPVALFTQNPVGNPSRDALIVDDENGGDWTREESGQLTPSAWWEG
jgi:hypothetical protein